MKNKNGFISMSLVYSFLIIFLFLMMAIINCYLKKNTYLEALNQQVSKDIGITRNAKASILTTILEENVAMQTTTVNFSKISNNSNKNGNGLYYVESTDMTDENNDGYGAKIYFFRGEVNNNNVVFGSKVTRNASGKIDTTTDLCWKIIRTNENGSIRLIYNGEKIGASCTGATPYIATSVYNENADSNAYVGYTYGHTGDNTSALSDNEKYLEEHYHTSSGEVFDSKVKSVLDNYFLNSTLFYYSTELSYEPASTSVTVKMRDTSIKDAVYCADRRINNAPVAGMNTITNGYIEGLGYSKSNTQYGAYKLISNPTFACDQSFDKYTLRVISGGTNEGLNALSYGIGLPTMADIIFAGGSTSANNTDYYLRATDAYWTMTPYEYNSTTTGAQVAAVDSNGKLVSKTVTSSLKVRPVISIDAKTLVLRGSGLSNDPYILD